MSFVEERVEGTSNELCCHGWNDHKEETILTPSDPSTTEVSTPSRPRYVSLIHP